MDTMSVPPRDPLHKGFPQGLRRCDAARAILAAHSDGGNAMFTTQSTGNGKKLTTYENGDDWGMVDSCFNPISMIIVF